MRSISRLHWVAAETVMEATLANVSRMSELQDALNRYGETSIRNYKIIHPIGEKVIEGFSAYLGEAGCVLNVPPNRGLAK
jgi:hypothetical protein